MNTPTTPKTGLGLMLIKNDTFLLGERRGSHGAGEYAGPGGHLEYGESFKASLLREFREEVGNDIVITDLRFLCLTNLRQYLPRHFTDIGMVAEWVSGEPIVMEPDKVVKWEWAKIDSAPINVFGAVNNYITAYRTGQTFFDT